MKTQKLLPMFFAVCLLASCGAAGLGTTNSTASSKSSGALSVGVFGTVVDKNGAPVSGVKITAYWTNNHTSVTATTGSDGTYTLVGLGAGNSTDYQIYAESSAYGFYPAVGSGSMLKADYNGLYKTVLHLPSVSATPIYGMNFTAYRTGDKVTSLPRTGQTASYVAGDDASANKGVAWPGSRFTNNNDGTVTDGLTGLVWTKNAGCFSSGSWSGALTAANNLASGACGLTDGSTAGQWRMPNVNELESLVDVSQSNPALTAGHPFTNVANSYWSSTTYVASPTNAMVIRFTDGRWINGNSVAPYNNDKTTSLNTLWAVKSGNAGAVKLLTTGGYIVSATGDDAYHTCPFCEGTVNGIVNSTVVGDAATLANSAAPPFPRFVDNGDGTLSDTATGLVWLKKADCINGTWSGAIASVNNLASGQCGLTDGSTAGKWRTPNRFEMLSIAERAATFPIATYYDGIYGADGVTVTGPVVFTNFMASQYYWTSTTDAADVTQAWTVYSCDFGAYNIAKTAAGYSLAVR